MIFAHQTITEHHGISLTIQQSNNTTCLTPGRQFNTLAIEPFNTK